MKTAFAILNEKKMLPRVLDWGLHGELVRRGIKKPKEVFARHVEVLSRVLKQKVEVIRDFMDHKSGRHYADSLPEAILAQPTEANAIRHPWIKKQLKFFLRGYDPKTFSVVPESAVKYEICGEVLMELNKGTEYAKAKMRLQSFWDKTVGAGKPEEKFNNMVNLRTKKMTKLLKVKLWYEVLEDENYHSLAQVAFKRMKELGG
jgi:hypothetical protein